MLRINPLEKRSDMFSELLSGLIAPRPQPAYDVDKEFENALQLNEMSLRMDPMEKLEAHEAAFILGIAKEMFKENHPVDAPGNRTPEINETLKAASAVALHIEMMELRREFEMLVNKCLNSTGNDLEVNKAKLKLNINKQFRLEHNPERKKSLENVLDEKMDEYLKLRREFNQLVDKCINSKNPDEYDNNIARLQQNLKKLWKMEPSGPRKTGLELLSKPTHALDDYIKERQQNRDALSPKPKNKNAKKDPDALELAPAKDLAEELNTQLLGTNSGMVTGMSVVILRVAENYNGIVDQNVTLTADALSADSNLPGAAQGNPAAEEQHRRSPLNDPTARLRTLKPPGPDSDA
jgi:hypothetical protein